eukprot:GILK01012582.1.p1 GENE.GILK01012582.1~~GILK01012582.1.p1  ORF type:complete len:1522 (-),score=167.33 GILK01012582.1:220-4434(-)
MAASRPISAEYVRGALVEEIGAVLEHVHAELTAKQKTLGLKISHVKSNEERDIVLAAIGELATQFEQFHRTIKAIKHYSTLNLVAADLRQQTATELQIVQTLWKPALQREFRRFKQGLPIYGFKDTIVSMLSSSQIIVVTAATGSGKTTQMAQYIADEVSELGSSKLIVCTQPRRVAAISIAKRVSEEYGAEAGRVGGDIGYKVGGAPCTSKSTRIVFMTDSTLVNEATRDRNLSAYSVVIVDEAHERSINTDVIMGLLKQCCSRRRDLKVIITSATIDPKKFCGYFGDCLTVDVPGRTFPVDIVYRGQLQNGKTCIDAAVQAVVDIHKNQSQGDILAFLTGQADIDRACAYASSALKSVNKHFEVFPMYGSLRPEDQEKVFEFRGNPENAAKRMIVFSTNVAEASVTIPGIRYVVDSGLSNEASYDPVKRVNMLNVTSITKASAIQRAGRAGRTSPGTCIRLYSEEEFNNPELFSPDKVPEILRSNLDMTILKFLHMKIDPNTFDFLDRPSDAAFEKSWETLVYVDAVTGSQLTETGRLMLSLPFDPSLSKCIITANSLGCGLQMSYVASMLSISESLFFIGSNPEEKTASKNARSAFFDPEGCDFFALLSIYEQWVGAGQNIDDGSSSCRQCQFKVTSPGHGCARCQKRWCVTNFINNKKINIAFQNVNAVISAFKDKRLKMTSMGASVSQRERRDALGKALCSGLFDNACTRFGECYKILASDMKVIPDRSSSLLHMATERPTWVLYHALTKTVNNFIRTVCPIQPQWLQEFAPKWCAKTRFDAIDDGVSRWYLEALGTAVLQEFVGPRHSKVQELEEQLNSCIIADFRSARLEVWCADRDRVHAEHILRSKVQAARKSVELQTVLAVSSAHVRFHIGAGGRLVQILSQDGFDTIDVSGLPNNMDNSDVSRIFSKFGTIASCNILKGNRAFVQFREVESAKRALQEVDGFLLLDNELEVQPSLGKEKPRIFVSGRVKPNCSRACLRKWLLTDYGYVWFQVSIIVSCYAGNQEQQVKTELKDVKSLEQVWLQGRYLSVKVKRMEDVPKVNEVLTRHGGVTGRFMQLKVQFSSLEEAAKLVNASHELSSFIDMQEASEGCEAVGSFGLPLKLGNTISFQLPQTPKDLTAHERDVFLEKVKQHQYTSVKGNNVELELRNTSESDPTFVSMVELVRPLQVRLKPVVVNALVNKHKGTLQEIMDATGSIIHLNTYQNSAFVYGSESEKSHSVSLLQPERTIHQTQLTVCTNQVKQLSSKALQKTLKDFSSRHSVMVQIQMSPPSCTVMGIQKIDVLEAAAALHKMVSELSASTTMSGFQRSTDCPLCASAIQHMHQLNNCGHILCSDCLQIYIENQASSVFQEDRVLVCPIPACRKLLLPADWNVMSHSRLTALYDIMLERHCDLL